MRHDTTEKDIRNLFANQGELDRDEIAMLLLQLVERIQNLERAPQRTWVGLTDDEIDNINYTSAHMLAREVEARLKEKNENSNR